MTINCKGQLIDLTFPRVMGILNITPDSFYDGGKYKDIDAVVGQVGQMLEDGATFIDIGAYSSRPGAIDISTEEEEKRLLPVVQELIRLFPDILISIDTFRASVAQKGVDIGVAMINDISAGKLDSKMLESVGRLGVPYCMMHMRGTPQTMKTLTKYSDITKEVLQYFSERLYAARAAKINDILIDPGFGFAKTMDQNFQLLSQLDIFGSLEAPILAGLSRKSMIYKTLKITAEQALNGTTALHMVALSKGAKILRVHDVKPAMECIKLHSSLSRK